MFLWNTFRTLSMETFALQWIAANESVSAFDFNGNGRIDFNDNVVLFGKI
jgi:PKD repeat protein